MNDLSYIQLKSYVRSDCACPKCGSDDVIAGRFESDSTGASRRVDCSDCKAAWVEGFTLAAVSML